MNVDEVTLGHNPSQQLFKQQGLFNALPKVLSKFVIDAFRLLVTFFFYLVAHEGPGKNNIPNVSVPKLARQKRKNQGLRTGRSPSQGPAGTQEKGDRKSLPFVFSLSFLSLLFELCAQLLHGNGVAVCQRLMSVSSKTHSFLEAFLRF